MSPPNACPVFPDFDAGTVREAARWLGTASVDLSSAGRDMSGVLQVPSWTGRAHNHWLHQGTVASQQYSRASQAFSEASQAMSRLATEVEDQKRAFDGAMDRYLTASSSVLSAEGALSNFIPRPNADANANFLGNLRARLDDARADSNAALAEAWAAVEAAHQAGRRASSVLGSAAGGAQGLGDFAGFGGGSAPSFTEGPEINFLVMLFGSIADNYLAGRGFQTSAMQRLGLTENFRGFTVQVNGRNITTIPDAFRASEMFEFKNSFYVYGSRQILAQLNHAASSGQGYTLVVRHNSRISASLQQLVRAHPYGGEIVRMQSDGNFTTLDGRAVERMDDGGWRYKDPDDRDRGDGEGGSGGGLNHPDGQEEDRISVDEYREMPNQANMTPVMPWPSFPMPMPLPAPAPMPGPVLVPRLLPIP